MSPTTLTVIRNVLMFLGALAVNQGWLSNDQLGPLVNNLLGAGGTVVSLAMLVWSIYHQFQQKRAAAAAAVISAASGTPTPVVVKGLTLPTVANAVISPTAAADVAKVKGAT